MSVSDQEYSRGLPGLSPAAAWATLTDLGNIGLRWMGTRGEILARDYMLNKMSEVGLKDVHLEEFPYLNYIPLSSELNIVSPIKSSSMGSLGCSGPGRNCSVGPLLFSLQLCGPQRGAA